MAKELREILKSARNLVLAFAPLLGDPAVNILVKMIEERDRLADALEVNAELAALDEKVRRLDEALERTPAEVRAAVFDLLRLVEEKGSPIAVHHPESCLAILQALSEQSKTGMAQDPDLSHSDAVTILAGVAGVEDPEVELEMVAHELERTGLVSVNVDGNSRRGIGSLGPTDEFFWRFDPMFQEWSPEADARRLCQFGLVEKPGNVQIPETAAELGWPARRMNPAIEHLLAHKRIHPDGGMAVDWRMRAIMLLPAARLFLEESKARPLIAVATAGRN